MRTALVAASTACLIAATHAHALTIWPPRFTVTGTQCGDVVARASLSVSGEWFCPAIPRSVRARLNADTIVVTVVWGYAEPPPCASVVTPWSYPVEVTGIFPSTLYRVVAEFEGPLPGLQSTDIGALAISCACVADFDDGSGLGHTDAGVTIDDLLYYLRIFDEGRVRADLDDGSGTGARDGAVTLDDLLYFLARFDAGC